MTYTVDLRDEHLLYGSLPFQDKMERKAAAKGRTRTETRELGLMIRWVYTMPEDQINSHLRDSTGFTLHHTLVNRVIVLDALATLTTLQRWCLIHYWWHELSDAVVAASYEITESAVRRARSHAYDRLAPLLYDRESTTIPP